MVKKIMDEIHVGIDSGEYVPMSSLIHAYRTLQSLKLETVEECETYGQPVILFLPDGTMKYEKEFFSFDSRTGPLHEAGTRVLPLEKLKVLLPEGEG